MRLAVLCTPLSMKYCVVHFGLLAIRLNESIENLIKPKSQSKLVAPKKFFSSN